MNDLKDIIRLGRWTIEELDHLIHESSTIKDISERIYFLSRQFLGVEYQESTLIGDVNKPEVFVINLEGVDCLTFIEYVEAMRLSGSFSEFTKKLKWVRYCQGKVAFDSRHHFFTDWGEYHSDLVEDVTVRVGEQKTMSFPKSLNLRRDGAYIIPGIRHKDRVIQYIPHEAIDGQVMDRLKTGDYAGIYSDQDGLDVSHVGIIIRIKDGIYLRHASSSAASRKVIDENFRGYIAKKQGLVVLRPKPVSSPASDP